MSNVFRRSLVVTALNRIGTSIYARGVRAYERCWNVALIFGGGFRVRAGHVFRVPGGQDNKTRRGVSELSQN